MNTWSSQGSNYSWYFYNHEFFVLTLQSFSETEKQFRLSVLNHPSIPLVFNTHLNVKSLQGFCIFSIYKLFIHMIKGVSGSIIPFYLQFNGFLYIGLSKIGTGSLFYQQFIKLKNLDHT